MPIASSMQWSASRGVPYRLVPPIGSCSQTLARSCWGRSRAVVGTINAQARRTAAMSLEAAQDGLRQGPQVKLISRNQAPASPWLTARSERTAWCRAPKCVRQALTDERRGCSADRPSTIGGNPEDSDPWLRIGRHAQARHGAQVPSNTCPRRTDPMGNGTWRGPRARMAVVSVHSNGAQGLRRRDWRIA